MPVATADDGGLQSQVAVRGGAPGSRIEQYEIIRPLGRGGMGEVHLARALRLGRLVAIKLLTTQKPDLDERVLAEARATARCRHENIVVIYDVGAHGRQPYLVLEYLEGQTLRQWMTDRATAELPATMPPPRALELMLPVVRALAYAHDQGIVHRDLKPENVMLTRTGVIKVLDFGVAKRVEVPAPGLAAFQEADADRFFGRDREIDQVVAELRSRPLVAVVGPSGAERRARLCAVTSPPKRATAGSPGRGVVADVARFRASRGRRPGPTCPAG